MIEGHMDTKELKQKICKEYGVQPSAVCVYQNEHGTFVQMYNARTKEMKAVSEKDVEEINKTFATFKEKDKTRLDCYIEAIVTVSAT